MTNDLQEKLRALAYTAGLNDRQSKTILDAAKVLDLYRDETNRVLDQFMVRADQDYANGADPDRDFTCDKCGLMVGYRCECGRPR